MLKSVAMEFKAIAKFVVCALTAYGRQKLVCIYDLLTQLIYI